MIREGFRPRHSKLNSLQLLPILRRAPLATVAAAAAVSVAARFVVALQIRTPLYYPDEYLYAAISRSFADGSFGNVRGARVPWSDLLAYFAPLVTSPVWLISNVAVSYRLSQAIASVAFASAGFAAYALARRVGIAAGGACVVGLLTLLVPAGAFTTTLLSEPYAYPFFLVSMLVAIDTVGSPSLRRLLLLAALSVGLCAVGGLQFIFFAPACAVAYIITSPTLRSALARAALGVLLGGATLLALAVGGGDALPNFITRVNGFSYPIPDIAAWFGVNLFVLALASGWLIMPGAILGLGRLARSGDRRARSFAALSIVVMLALLLEAAIWGSNGLGLYERFTFYASPLLAIAFVSSMSAQKAPRWPYASLSYAAAAGAILLPLTDRLFIDDDHSPTLVGLSYGLIVHLSSPPVVWAPLLCVLAVLTALFGTGRPQNVLVGTAIVCIVMSVAGSRALIDLDETVVPRLDGQASAFVTYPGGDPYYLEKSLFWNPGLQRVVVLGGTTSPDGFASVPAHPGRNGLLLSQDGRPIEGPFAVGPDTLAGARARHLSNGDELATFVKQPSVLAFGWYGNPGLLAPFGRIFAGGDRHRQFRLLLRLRGIGSVETVGWKCRTRRARTIVVPPTGTTIVLPVNRDGFTDCRFGLAGGAVKTVQTHSVIARASLSIKR